MGNTGACEPSRAYGSMLPGIIFVKEMTLTSLNKLLQVGVHVVKNRWVAIPANEGRYQHCNLKIPHRLDVCQPILTNI